jgi:predicted hydrocarbon binding protein
MVKESLFHEFISKNIISVQDGRLKILNNIDITSYGSNAWVWTLNELGNKKNEAYIFELGYLMGLDAAKESFDLISKKKAFVTEKITDITNVIEITGFGLVEINRVDDEIILNLQFNHIIQLSKDKYGEKSKACAFYRGIYSAFIEIFMGIKVKLEDKKCICSGGDHCIYSSKIRK